MSIEHSPGTSVLPPGAEQGTGVATNWPLSVVPPEPTASALGFGLAGVAKELGRIASVLERADAREERPAGTYTEAQHCEILSLCQQLWQRESELKALKATPASPPIAERQAPVEALGAISRLREELSSLANKPEHATVCETVGGWRNLLADHDGQLADKEAAMSAMSARLQATDIEMGSLKRQLAEREGLLREVLGCLPEMPELARRRIREALEKAGKS